MKGFSPDSVQTGKRAWKKIKNAVLETDSEEFVQMLRMMKFRGENMKFLSKF